MSFAHFHNIFLWLVMAALMSLALLFVIPLIPFFHIYQFAVVRSAAMEPFIPLGSLAVFSSANGYSLGDVVVFNSDLVPPDTVAVRRIIQSNKKMNIISYLTKADSYELKDAYLLTPEHIKGRVWLVIPQVGRLIHLLRSPLGMIVILFVPCFILAMRELSRW